MEASEVEMVDITINYKGTDFALTVDIYTANALLNDQGLAAEYVEKAFPHIVGESFPPHSVESDDLGVAESDVKEVERNPRKVWFSKGKPSKDDDAATALFLELRQKYAAKFDDRKTVKSQLWQKIATKLEESGFDICAGSKEGPSGKCKQKFINLERSYIQHIKHVKTTGEAKRDPPPFYDEMHSILGCKDKVNPTNVIDTEAPLSSNLSTSDSDSLSQSPCSSSTTFNHSTHSTTSSTTNTTRDEITNRFSKTKKPLRPQSTGQILAEEMRREHDIDRRDQAERTSRLEALLMEQNQQRGTMIELMKDLVPLKKKAQKRKRERSASESDSD